MNKPKWVQVVVTTILIPSTLSFIWGLVQLHVLKVGSQVIKDPHMLSVLYVFLASLAIGVLVAVNWPWIGSHRPKNKLHSLLRPAEKIYDTLRLADRDGWDDLNWGEFDRTLRYLSHGVKQLGFYPLPTAEFGHPTLKEWLLLFLPIAKAKDIREMEKLSRLGIVKYRKQNKPKN